MECRLQPDGRRIVSASGERTLRLRDVESGVEFAVLPGHERWVRSVAFSPDGLRIVSGGRDGTLRFWDASSGVEIAVLCGHVQSVAFSPDGRLIVLGSWDGTLRLWDTNSGVVLMTLGVNGVPAGLEFVGPVLHCMMRSGHHFGIEILL